MENCVFCKIAKKQLPASIIYEDELVLAFLDLNPLTEGHSLIIPKKHYENIFKIDKETLQRIISVAKKLSQKMEVVLGAEGVNLFQASGRAAEQSVFHFHLHLVPRREGDSLAINSWWQEKAKKADIKKLQELAKRIRKKTIS
jgi:histidine triad (HIT) family protein